ncbi:RNA polymerase factor sigma-54 [Prevotella communis]|jgi:RNA polymerase sigma-54 factor|uniref:RNA polymerase, sigma 54 subunit, RpoN/SigL n=1 Tax=Prevotella communis TaxID=2913614 RepID=A0A1H0K4L6_9BACT|nr:RNA polymerase factor sigma-54 [Prevotella communis]UKK67169.1 RNA polymerase factor sigma-54 [Prevotella communis]UKK70692.1 RNA polymerase factor sigma-54 [Prevotella communis]SDO50713.1 RNA polymerase, sigma 54 subunit, RpoN/SigL [Prevotella communis]
MAQSQIQEQKQEQRLQQAVSQQQLLQSHLIELPIQQFAERIETEMHDNPALESDSENPDLQEYPDYPDSPEATDDFDVQREREERSDALDAALENIGRDDEDLPVYHGGQSSVEEREEMVYGQSVSFYDELLEQVGEMELSDQERYVMEYLIRSLDDDGFLRTPLENIADELAIYHNIDLSTGQLETVLKKLQRLDPPGIGARTLQECLLLQVNRREKSAITLSMEKVLTDYFDEFTKKHWEKIAQQMTMDELQAETVFHELRRLNPKPGAAMGETIGRSMQQITPDFVVDTQDDGTVTFSLNNGDVPQLQVSQSFADLLKEYQSNKDGLSRQMKEALLYTKQKVDAAQSFIDAVQVRRRTLTLTMKAIIQLQHRFFEEGDEALLRPMILKDVAERTGLDLSTVSRVSNSKYVQTRWGIFPLKYFFSDGYVTESGEELSTREIKATLRELIDAEDKRKPMSDDALSEALKEKGYPIARRTVAKYREQLGIPIARLRK